MSEQIAVVETNDGITRRDHCLVKNEYVVDEETELEIPEGFMQKVEELLGDGNASITVSSELKNSDYGNAYGTFVSVKLTCNQDLDSIAAARDVAQQLAGESCEAGFEIMRDRFEFVMGKSEGPPKESKAPKKATDKVLAPAAKKKKAPAKKTAGPRPIFKR
jgi:hypothetical protein